MTKRIKILFLAANSLEGNQEWLQREIREIETKMRFGGHREAFELISHFAVRTSDLARILLQHQPHIVHFSGRGAKNQGIILENDAGQPQALSEEALKSLFRILKDNIRVIVFNAGYTDSQAEALAEIVDYTIGIKLTLEADTAVIFSAAFYQMLASGRTVKEAFDMAVTQLMLEKAKSYKRPFLRIRPGVNVSIPVGNGNQATPIGPASISDPLRQRCLELFDLFDELRTPADLRAFAGTKNLVLVRRCIPNSNEINYDQLIEKLLRTGRSISEPALFDLLDALADRYRGEYKAQFCESLMENISKELV